ncbi:hypothetical protein AKJ58_01500 [candidate division MSBL1 archaeon SCGC-AAA385D11]|uniref:Uncharacterized protein n=1 Tax=candidate division MSBL1 archaeon SCGC-AAA385D11 TaxID=1698286 RepID=A0A133VN74_9EURY|nr:hypothetical protein AKJ58_01500 [candidate division MSBL1 archaeon SCGC-AAA385D11]
MARGRRCEGCDNREFRLEPNRQGRGFKVYCTECGRQQELRAVPKISWTPLKEDDLRKLEELRRTVLANLTQKK